MITLQFNITTINNSINTTSPPPPPTRSTTARHQPTMASSPSSTSDLPTKMRAWTLTSAGLTLSPSHPLPGGGAAPSATPSAAPSATTQPTITGNNLLLKITHAALNPVDLHILCLFPHWLPFRRNPTSGFDFCGRVVAAGPAVDTNEFAVGDIVSGALGAADVFWGKGSLAEYLLVSSSLVAKKPTHFGATGKEVSGEEAVGLFGIAGQTAVLMAQTASLTDTEWKGKKCLVNGASGGVGSILTQILRGKGAEVWGTTGSVEGEELVRRCGGEVINYKTHHPITAHLGQLFGDSEDKKLDFIFDCAGSQEMFSKSPGYLKAEGGKFISIVGGASQGVVPYVRNKLRPVWLGGTPREFELLLLIPGKKTVREVGRLIEDGVVERGVVDGVCWEMEELVKAYERLGSGRSKGKVVVRVEE